MASYTIPSLVLTLALFSLSVAEGCNRCSGKRAFAEISCKDIHYWEECVQTLVAQINSTNYSQKDLAQIFLEESLKHARVARAYVAKWGYGLRETSPQDYKTASDCIDQIGSSMARISESIQELQHVKEHANVDEFSWHCSNVETWASAALTYQTTCFDALPGSTKGHDFKDAVKLRVDNVARLTSNALAMVNRYTNNHRVVRGVRRP